MIKSATITEFDVVDVYKLIFIVTCLPFSKVLRYGKDQYYHKHTDSLPGDTAGPRVATILIYLADVEEGGEVSDGRSLRMEGGGD